MLRRAGMVSLKTSEQKLTSLPWCWTAVAMPPRPASFNASSL